MGGLVGLKTRSGYRSIFWMQREAKHTWLVTARKETLGKEICFSFESPRVEKFNQTLHGAGLFEGLEDNLPPLSGLRLELKKSPSDSLSPVLDFVTFGAGFHVCGK